MSMVYIILPLLAIAFMVGYRAGYMARDRKAEAEQIEERLRRLA